VQRREGQGETFTEQTTSHCDSDMNPTINELDLAAIRIPDVACDVSAQQVDVLVDR
jgi:hypothetical protein